MRGRSNIEGIMRWILPLLLLFSTTFAKQEKVLCGAYIETLHGIDWYRSTVDSNFLVWYVSDNKDINFIDKMHIMNEIESKIILHEVVPLPDGRYLTNVLYQAKLLQNWKLSNFPFMRQMLQIELEPIHIDLQELEFVTDPSRNHYNPNLHLYDWKVTSFQVIPVVKTYHSTFGWSNRPNNDISYSRIDINMNFERQGWRLFFQLFGVLYLAYLLTFAVYFVPITELNSKMGLLIGATFAAIGNNFVLEKFLPPVGELTLSDKLQLLTFSLIAITVFIVLIARAVYKRSPFVAKVFEVCGGIVFFAVLIFCNWFWLQSAIVNG